MKNNSGINRRDFLATSAAATTVATSSGAVALDASPVTPTHQTRALVSDWARVTQQDLGTMIGQRFRVTAPDGRVGVLELIDAEPVQSGPARPSDLPRAEGVVAVFDSPDKDWFMGQEHAIHRVSHPVLGSADLFLGRSPKQNGGDVIEMVLN